MFDENTASWAHLQSVNVILYHEAILNIKYVWKTRVKPDGTDLNYLERLLEFIFCQCSFPFCFMSLILERNCWQEFGNIHMAFHAWSLSDCSFTFAQIQVTYEDILSLRLECLLMKTWTQENMPGCISPWNQKKVIGFLHWNFFHEN